MKQRDAKADADPMTVRGNLLVVAGLLGLLAASAISALIPLGAFNVVCNVGIAVCKALLVLVFFMRLRVEKPVIRIVAAAGFAWLALLIALALADVLTRVPLAMP